MFQILAAPQDQAIAAALRAALSALPSQRPGQATSLLVCTPALNRADALTPLMDKALEAWSRNAFIAIAVDGCPAPLGFRDAPIVEWPTHASASERQEFVARLEATAAPDVVAEPKLQTAVNLPPAPAARGGSARLTVLLVTMVLFAALGASLLWLPGGSGPQSSDPQYAYQEKLLALANRLAADLRENDPERSRTIETALARIDEVRLPKPALLLPKNPQPATHDAEWDALETAVTAALDAHPELIAGLQADGALDGLAGSGIIGVPVDPAAAPSSGLIVYVVLVVAFALGIGLIVFAVRRNRNAPAGGVMHAKIRAPSTTAQVFASYARLDARKVDSIVGTLQGGGIDVWIDRERLPGGQLWPAEIVRAIRDSQALAVFCSRHAFASDNVFRELHLAASFRKPLIPIALDPTPMPDTFLYYLSAHQSVSAAHVPAVRDALAKSLAPPGIPPALGQPSG